MPLPQSRPIFLFLASLFMLALDGRNKDAKRVEAERVSPAVLAAASAPAITVREAISNRLERFECGTSELKKAVFKKENTASGWIPAYLANKIPPQILDDTIALQTGADMSVVLSTVFAEPAPTSGEISKTVRILDSPFLKDINPLNFVDVNRSFIFYSANCASLIAAQAETGATFPGTSLQASLTAAASQNANLTLVLGFLNSPIALIARGDSSVAPRDRLDVLFSLLRTLRDNGGVEFRVRNIEYLLSVAENSVNNFNSSVDGSGKGQVGFGVGASVSGGASTTISKEFQYSLPQSWVLALPSDDYTFGGAAQDVIINPSDIKSKLEKALQNVVFSYGWKLTKNTKVLEITSDLPSNICKSPELAIEVQGYSGTAGGVVPISTSAGQCVLQFTPKRSALTTLSTGSNIHLYLQILNGSVTIDLDDVPQPKDF